MKLIGAWIIVGSASAVLFSAWKQRIHLLKRIREAQRLLLYLENGVEHLAAPLTDLLREYAAIHPENGLLSLPDDPSAPLGFLIDEKDSVSAELSSLFMSLGEIGRAESRELFAYHRTRFEQGEKATEKENETALRVFAPILLSLAAMLVILLY